MTPPERGQIREAQPDLFAPNKRQPENGPADQ